MGKDWTELTFSFAIIIFCVIINCIDNKEIFHENYSSRVG